MTLAAATQVTATAEPGLGAMTLAATQPAFSERIQAELDAVNTKMNVAAVELQQLAAGKQNDLHHVMLSLEDAKLSFQLMVQVRNKVLEAYQELMRMQI